MTTRNEVPGPHGRRIQRRLAEINERFSINTPSTIKTFANAMCLRKNEWPVTWENLLLSLTFIHVKKGDSEERGKGDCYVLDMALGILKKGDDNNYDDSSSVGGWTNLLAILMKIMAITTLVMMMMTIVEMMMLAMVMIIIRLVMMKTTMGDFMTSFIIITMMTIKTTVMI
jgi:hypothetical protein